MSDDERTPQGTARVSSERFDTELAAVWYAANYYYEASFRRGGDGRYGLMVRGDGGFAGSKVRVFDVPHATIPTAIWHTHVPSTSGTGDAWAKALLWIMSTFDYGLDQFSAADCTAAENATRVSRSAWGHSIAIYLITGTLIRRYRPASSVPEKSWAKAPPSWMIGT